MTRKGGSSELKYELRRILAQYWAALDRGDKVAARKFKRQLDALQLIVGGKKRWD